MTHLKPRGGILESTSVLDKLGRMLVLRQKALDKCCLAHFFRGSAYRLQSPVIIVKRNGRETQSVVHVCSPLEICKAHSGTLAEVAFLNPLSLCEQPVHKSFCERRDLLALFPIALHTLSETNQWDFQRIKRTGLHRHRRRSGPSYPRSLACTVRNPQACSRLW